MRIPPQRTRRIAAAAVACTGLLLGSLAAALAQPGDTAPEYRITALRVMLFNSDAGTLTRDVLQEPQPILWNTIIGEGDSGGASSAALVVVEVGGEPGSWEEERRVELNARTESGSVLRRAQDLHVMNEEGKTFLGFWLYDVGCEPVRLQARILGQRQASTRAAEIPYECGE